MMPAWIGLALLSGSWLFGLSFFHDAQPWVFAFLIAAGTCLVARLDIPRPSRGQCATALVLAGPALFLMPWPYRVMPLWIISGLVLVVVPIPRQWPKRLGMGFVAAGAVLAWQALAMWAYESVTARSHELPWPLTYVLYGMARLIGIDAALDGTTLTLHTMREVHRLGATWELLLDPPTWCFLVGGIVMLALYPAGRTWKGISRLVLSILIWLPIRAGLLLGIFIHRALRTEYDASLDLMQIFWNPWMPLILLAGLVMLAVRLVPCGSEGKAVSSATDQAPTRRTVLGIAAFGIGVWLLTLSLVWDPPGPRKAGRVIMDEHRSQWERTDRPFDTTWYGHESGYNYACIYDYCSRFYEMSRLEKDVDANTLASADVLIVKVPTARYDPREVQAIKDFVRRGGGLMLVGEHTNVFNIGVHINDIARQFGFVFRADCLFEIDTIFEQSYEPAWVPHPIVQDIPSLDFAVSCSVAPGVSAGKAVIRSTGLKNLTADYHASNFYPQVQDRAEMRYGAFIQLWARRYGKGRVVAFTDSTIYSNFAAFEEGKSELMLGMIEWLNHRNGPMDPRPWLGIIGIGALGTGLWLARRNRACWVCVIGIGLAAWAGAGAEARQLHHAAMSLPKPVRPYTHVVIDRTVCKGPLSKSGFIAGPKDGFGIFERWILRLGYFTSRRSGSEAFRGDALVFFYPTGAVTEDFRTRLVDYVRSGGKVLILDSPVNGDSKTNGLLLPFGLSVENGGGGGGGLKTPEGWPSVSVETALTVKGGDPLVYLQDRPVAATVLYGKGAVTVVGFGSRFSDMVMGVTGDVVPDENLKRVFDLEYAILRRVITGEAPSGTGP